MMYRVDLVQTVIEEATIFIEANNEQQAAEEALFEAERDATKIKWHFADSKDDPEILAVEAVQTMLAAE